MRCLEDDKFFAIIYPKPLGGLDVLVNHQILTDSRNGCIHF